jgi:DNA-binding LacI/PurR family transcriptional regulator
MAHLTIGVITNDATNVFQRQVITGIRTIAEEKGYDVAVDTVTAGTQSLPPLSVEMEALSGVLVIANILPDAVLREVYQSGKPLSLVSHRVQQTPIPAVIPDNIGGIVALADYLVGRGKRRIAFIQGDMNQNDGQERTNAFKRQLMRHDIEIDERLFLRGDFEPLTAAESMQAFLADGIPFDAVAGADFLMAIAAKNVLKVHRIHDVCVVGFGDGPEAADARLTTVGVDVEQIGKRAARQLIGQIEGLQIRGVTLLNTMIVERDSC